MSSLMDGRLIHQDGPLSVTGYHPTQAHCDACGWHGAEHAGRPSIAGVSADIDLAEHARSPEHAQAVGGGILTMALLD
jgi:hypothetical protein